MIKHRQAASDQLKKFQWSKKEKKKQNSEKSCLCNCAAKKILVSTDFAKEKYIKVKKRLCAARNWLIYE